MTDVVVRDLTNDIPPEIVEEVAEFRYRQEFRLSKREMMLEPADALPQAQFMWELDARRDKLEEERRKQ